MVWEKGAQNGGFSQAKPWLPVNRSHIPLAVNVQQADPNALLHRYRHAIAVRKHNEALRCGTQSPLCAQGEVVYFQREHQGEVVYCAFNISNQTQALTPPKGDWQNLATDFAAAQAPDSTSLPPWGCIVAKAL